MNVESEVDKLIAKKHWFKNSYLKFVCIFVIGIFITMAVIVPAVTNKSGFTILQEWLSGSDSDSGDVLADEPPLEPEAYHYWYAPENSFGISEMRTVNWSYFQNWSMDNLFVSLYVFKYGFKMK